MKGREMRRDLLPFYLRNLTIRGFEEDDKDKETKSEEESDSEDEEEEDQKKDKTENNDGLKSALQKERLERKRFEKEARELRKFRDEAESKDKSDTDKAKDDASKAESKALKLAIKLKETAVDNAIIKVGNKQRFRDIDDALKLIDRSLIAVDQDEDDPGEVDVDEASVKSALEKLAKAKPHLIVAEGQEDKSGSKFNGGKKPTKDADEAVLKGKYPALNRTGISS